MRNNFQGKDMQLCCTTQFQMPLHFINKPKGVNAPEGFNQVFSLKHLFNGKNEFF